MQPNYRIAIEANELLQQYPPGMRHPHKQALLELAYPPDVRAAGMVEVTQWPQRVPASLPMPVELKTELRPDFFDYMPVPGAAGAMEWHVNFADPALFVAFHSSLFAQDEMQVAEHPLLACVRLMLKAKNLDARTETGLDQATPILVTGVERRLSIATNPDAAAGRPHGLYGFRFAEAPWDAVRRAARVIEPPTRSNILAIAAPANGRGEYTERQTAIIFATAYTGFAAAVHESRGKAAIIHSGFWGCGAFGGNRKLMIAAQALAARAAGVSRLVLHCGDPAGVEDARRGLDVADTIAQRNSPTAKPKTLAIDLAMMGYQWGVSDGN